MCLAVGLDILAETQSRIAILASRYGWASFSSASPSQRITW